MYQYIHTSRTSRMDLIAMLARCQPAREIIVHELGDLWGAADLRATCRATRAMFDAPLHIHPFDLEVRWRNSPPLVAFATRWNTRNYMSMKRAIEQKSPKDVRALKCRVGFRGGIATYMAELAILCGHIDTYRAVLDVFYIKCVYGHIGIASASSSVDMCKFVVETERAHCGDRAGCGEVGHIVSDSALMHATLAGRTDVCDMLIKEYEFCEEILKRYADESTHAGHYELAQLLYEHLSSRI